MLAELTETPTAALGRFRVDATPAGDTALVQAASGSRGAFSVGFEVDDSEEVDGIVDVKAARVVEVSLLALGAFDGAAVERVAAEHDEPLEPIPDEPDAPPAEPNPDQTELPVTPATPAEPEEGPMQEEATAPARVSATARPTEQATATPPPTDIPTWTPLPTIEAQGAPVVEEQPQGAVEPPPEAAPVDAPLPPTPLVYSPCAWWHPPMAPKEGCP